MTKFAPLLGLVLVFGCGDDDSRPDIMLMDTGPRVDGGGGTDTGGFDSGPGVDSGGGGTCNDPLPLLPSEALPRCSMDTLTCLMGCADAACQNACIDADTTPPVDVGGGATINCLGCLNLQTFACGSMNGCGTQWGAWNCCLEACTDPNPDNCFPMCMTEQNAFFGCLDGLGTTCQSALLSCFP